MDKQASNIRWTVVNNSGQCPTWEHVIVAVLMDIRQELYNLNSLLACQNFTGMPRTLRKIAANTDKKPRKPRLHKAKGA